MKNFSLRKIISAAVLLITGLAVTYTNGDIPPNLLSLMQTLFFAFVCGNGFEHYMEVVKSKAPKQLQNVINEIESKEQ